MTEGLPRFQRLKRAITGKEPMAYRGVGGLPFIIKKELTDEQKQEILRIKAVASDQVKKLEHAADASDQLKLDEAKLVLYFAGWFGRSVQHPHFNLSRNIATGWAASAGSYVPFRRMYPWDQDESKKNWANETGDLIASLAFVLGARMPKGLDYDLDRGGIRDTVGTQVRPRETDIAKEATLELVERVRYMKKVYKPSDQRIRPIIEPLFAFQGIIEGELLKLDPSTSLQDVIEIFHRAYQQSGLQQAVAEHQSRVNAAYSKNPYFFSE